MDRSSVLQKKASLMRAHWSHCWSQRLPEVASANIVSCAFTRQCRSLYIPSFGPHSTERRRDWAAPRSSAISENELWMCAQWGSSHSPVLSSGEERFRFLLRGWVPPRCEQPCVARFVVICPLHRILYLILMHLSVWVHTYNIKWVLFGWWKVFREVNPRCMRDLYVFLIFHT